MSSSEQQSSSSSPSSTTTWSPRGRIRLRVFSASLILLFLFQLQPDHSILNTTAKKLTDNKKGASNRTQGLKKNRTITGGAQTRHSHKETSEAHHVIANVTSSKKAKKKAHHESQKLEKKENKHNGIKSLSKHDRSKHAIEAFNYTSFWEKAMDEAFASLSKEKQTPSSSSPSTCPKVFVYDLPSKLVDGPRKKTVRSAYGSRINQDAKFKEYLYGTSQYALGTILEYRLRNSKHCYTNNPSEADLFYAPIFTKPKYGSALSSQCHKIDGEMVLDALNHLNESNACRHFFTLGKGHYNGNSCKGWYSSPIKELNCTQRLAYSHFSFSKSRKGAHSFKSQDKTQKLYPNLASVPYPSSLHFKAKTPTSQMAQFSNSTKRRTLMSFLGKSSHGDRQVRFRIVRMCKNYKDTTICKSSDWKPKLATAKAKAVFCLEPAGDSPWRKSLSDDITFGCIPVLFSELTDEVAPWFWKDWKHRARVLVPRREFVAGDIDLKKLLQSIPQQLLELMQATLKNNARKFQYSVDDDQDDGIRVILDNLYGEALRMEDGGLCGYKHHALHTV